MDLASCIRNNILRGGDQPIVRGPDAWRDWDWINDVSNQILDVVNGRGACALVARNRPQHVAAFASGILGHHTTSMIYSAQSATGIARDIESMSMPVVLAAPEDWSDETLAAAQRCGSIAVALHDRDNSSACIEVRHHGETSSNRCDSVPNAAFQLLSSGTTGSPKRITLGWQTLNAAVADARSAYSGTANVSVPQIVSHPMGNVASIGYIAPPLVYNQQLVLLEKFDPLLWAAAVRDHRPVRGSVPPAGIRMLLEANISKQTLSSLKVIVVGGGKLDPELQEQFEETFDIPVMTAFGATEFGGVIANWTPDLYASWGKRKRGSAGRASQNVELRIVDASNGEPLAPGLSGLLEAKVARIGSEWIRTNDLATIDEDGFLFHHGRADLAINRGGFKVVPEKVDAAIQSHPSVLEAATVGIADDRLGEVPAAAVALAKGKSLSEEQLRLWLQQRLLAYEIPVQFQFVTEIPRNASMKISISDIKGLIRADR